jgi:hypothetical protein
VLRSDDALTTLVSFDGANGLYPFAGLISDAAGDLFGMTSSGGASGLWAFVTGQPNRDHRGRMDMLNG